MNNPEPVIVFYKSPLCHHCTEVSNIWDTPPSKYEDSIVNSLKKVNPKIRFFIVTAKDKTGVFDENVAPKDLMRYATSFPQILLIPGKTWDAAMAKLGNKNDIKLIDGVKVMNGRWDNGKLKDEFVYNNKNPSEYERWLKDCYEDDDFKRVQFGTELKIPLTPLKSSKPLITKQSTKSTNEYVLSTVGQESCSVRLISRTK